MQASFYPLVSIIIPVYNGSDYLSEAINSALDQTYRNIEIIVVNDGSTDGGKTEDIAVSYGNKIKYIPKENGGVATALNAGIKNMKGEYFSWLSHDDLYYRNKIEQQVKKISVTQKKVFIYSDLELINEKNEHLGFLKLKNIYRKNPQLSLIFNQINGCTTLIHKDILYDCGLFPEKCKTTQDYHLWISIFSGNYSIIHCDEILIKSRLHRQQGSLTMTEVHKAEIIEVEKRTIRELAVYQDSHIFQIAKYYFYRRIDVFPFLINEYSKKGFIYKFFIHTIAVSLKLWQYIKNNS